MIRHASALRQHRRSLRRNDVNKRNKTALKTRVKFLRQQIQDNNKNEAEKSLPLVFSSADRAAKKKALHKNKAARLKSRLSRQVRATNPSPAP